MCIRDRIYTRYKQCTSKLVFEIVEHFLFCLLYTSPSPRDLSTSRMPSSAWKKHSADAAGLVGRLLLVVRVPYHLGCFLMIRRPPRSTHCISSAASDVYKRQFPIFVIISPWKRAGPFIWTNLNPVSYTHLRAHETSLHLVCRLLLEKNFEFPSTKDALCQVWLKLAQ